MPHEVTAADGGWRVLFAFVAPWPAAATEVLERMNVTEPKRLHLYAARAFRWAMWKNSNIMFALSHE